MRPLFLSAHHVSHLQPTRNHPSDHYRRPSPRAPPRAGCPRLPLAPYSTPQHPAPCFPVQTLHRSSLHHRHSQPLQTRYTSSSSPNPPPRSPASSSPGSPPSSTLSPASPNSTTISPANQPPVCRPYSLSPPSAATSSTPPPSSPTRMPGTTFHPTEAMAGSGPRGLHGGTG